MCETRVEDRFKCLQSPSVLSFYSTPYDTQRVMSYIVSRLPLLPVICSPSMLSKYTSDTICLTLLSDRNTSGAAGTLCR